MTDLNYKAYNENAQKYIDHNQGGTTGGLTPALRVERFKKFLPTGRILEIGSGEGLDALALKDAGYSVIASDFVESFIGILRQKGLRALALNIKTDSIPEDIQPLDGIYANAVFVHFSPEEFKQALHKIHAALRPNGHLYFSVILGQGHEVAGRAKGIEREFYYYDEGIVQRLLVDTGFTIDLLEQPIDEKWLHVIAHRA
jgi:2-polyprenyl-3-methyl-5-hydroxy-6-metoxy-1,4-benzoquinol methylase